jgi:NAD(P)-dependent dehydrogenase (short-subunit alcohol dehydrogenase family)
VSETEGGKALARLFGLTGKLALITGGTKGIGALAAQTFLRQGAEVVITSRRQDAADEAARSLSALGPVHGLVADLSDPDGARRLGHAVRERWDAVHILVNNAGATWGAPLRSYPPAAWAKVMQLDVAAPFQVVQQLLDLLESAAEPADPARVINIGSIDGHSAGPFENYAYGAAKAGLLHLTHLLARELGPRRVTVNCLALGPVRTKMTAALFDTSGPAMIASNPLGRLGELRDVAAPLLLLAGPGGSYITGAVLPVDGGFGISRWCESVAVT